MISRRRYLAGTSAVVAGAAGAVVLGLEPFATAGVAATDGDVHGHRGEKFKHKGRDVEVVEHGEEVMVTIDGKKKVHAHRSGRTLHSHLLPFQDYRTGKQFAVSVIDAEDAALLVL